VPRRKELNRLAGHTDDVYAVTFSPGGSRLASVGYKGDLFIWDVGAAREIVHEKVAPNTMTFGIAWSPNGRTLAVAASDNRAYLFDTP
jgi:WD40 repeat protein